MEEILAHSRHFFKVLIPGFQKKLNVPPTFCKKLILEEKSEWAILKSRKGKWKIKVCKNGEGVTSFEFGWAEFVDEHNLSIGDFVVFEHVGGLKFNVLMFDSSACEKEFVIEAENEKADDSRPKKSNKGAEKELALISDDTRNLHFITTITSSHAKEYAEVNIPIKFVRLNNIGEKTSAILRDGGGRWWAVNVLVRRHGHFRMSLHRGWHDFYVSNHLKIGDMCIFYLNPSLSTPTNVLFDVKIRPHVNSGINL